MNATTCPTWTYQNQPRSGSKSNQTHTDITLTELALISQRARKDRWPVLRAKLRGRYQYYGVSGNIHSLTQFYSLVERMTLKWLINIANANRSSGKSFVDTAGTTHCPSPE